MLFILFLLLFLVYQILRLQLSLRASYRSISALLSAYVLFISPFHLSPPFINLPQDAFSFIFAFLILFCCLFLSFRVFFSCPCFLQSLIFNIFFSLAELFYSLVLLFFSVFLVCFFLFWFLPFFCCLSFLLFRVWQFFFFSELYSIFLSCHVLCTFHFSCLKHNASSLSFSFSLSSFWNNSSYFFVYLLVPLFAPPTRFPILCLLLLLLLVYFVFLIPFFFRSSYAS